MAWQDTPFVTGVNDKLAKTDVYKESRDATVNEKADKINENLDILDRLKNDPRYVKKTSERLKQKEIKKITDKNAILGRAAKLLGGDYSLITDLLPENLALLLKLYESKDDLRIFKSNGKKKHYTSSQIDSYEAANALVDNVAPIPAPVDPGDPVITPDPRINTTSDVTSQAAILTTAITSFSKLKDPDSIANTTARIQDVDVKQEVYLSIIDTLIESSDLANLNSAVDELGADLIIARRPNIIPDILGAFVIPIEDTINDYSTLRTALLNLLTKINPYWYLTIRGDTTIRNLNPYILMSEDAKIIITQDPIHRAACFISDSYREANIIDVARTYFPLSPI